MISHKIEFANTLRGVAALLVLMHHYLIIFWMSRAIPAMLLYMPALSYHEYATPSYIKLINLYPFFDYGALGVALFFLISGFVIPFSLKKSDPYQFIINRIFRIAPVYIFGFSITLLMLWLCGIYFDVAFPYSAKEIVIHYFPGLHEIFYSRSIDGIIWTLEIEIKFYAICLFAYMLFKKLSLYVFWIPIAMATIAILLDVQQVTFPIFVSATHYIIFMFIGVIFNYLYNKKISFKVTFLLSSSFLCMFSFLDYQIAHEINLSINISYLFAFLLFSVIFRYPWLLKGNRFFNYFADISYPLYVIHGVSGFVTLRILLNLHISVHIALMITILCAFLLSTLIHYFIEIPAKKYGKQLQNRYQKQFQEKNLLLESD